MNTDTATILTRVLTDEADAIDVDVPALHRRVLDRIEDPQTSPKAGAPRGRRSGRLLVAAAAVVLLAAGAVGVGRLLDGPRLTDVADGTVDTAFDCPQVSTIDFATSTDDGFLPDLSDGATPADVAAFEHAPRYVFDVADDGLTATLRLGNADGSLGSMTRYEFADGEWQMRTAQVCGGAGDQPLAPVDDALVLGRHGTTPWPPTRFARDATSAAFVDDRPYYNLAGVIEGHRSMYVSPCGGRWCWVAGEPDSYLSGSEPAFSRRGAPVDVSSYLVNPDMMVGRENAYALWAIDGTRAQVRSFTAELRDGSVVESRVLTRPAWEGRRVLVVLAPAADVVALDAVRGDGTRTRWNPAELTSR